MIICPFLTKRIPEQLWSNDRVPCLVVHPGIEGDRGKHSLDWALHQNSSQWGVTVLEPSDEMDAGDIWSTKRFKVQRDDLDTLTKSSLYANEVTDAATSAVLEAVENFTLGVNPRPLDYSNPVVKGESCLTVISVIYQICDHPNLEVQALITDLKIYNMIFTLDS